MNEIRFHRKLMQLGVALMWSTLSGCGGGGAGGATAVVQALPTPIATAEPHSQCTLGEARQEVLALFEQFYFFNDDLRFPGQLAKYALVRQNLDAFEDIDALLDELRFQPGIFDRGFTNFQTREAVEQFFDAGQFVGFGVSIGLADAGLWRVIDVFASSPAADAGLRRGDWILEVNGIATSPGTLADPATLGPAEVGVTRELLVRTFDGTERRVMLSKRSVGLDPVPSDGRKVLDVGGRRVGYLYFRTFIEPAEDRLREAIADFAVRGVQDVVLDVRYNGGGLVATAEVLGGLLVGPDRAGQPYFEFQHNPVIAGANDQLRFFPLEFAGLTALENVYYLTGPATASASELTLSGVAPYVDTVKVGETTFGKPVGQWGLRYCNDSMVLFLVTFETVNSLGEGGFFTGIPADCSAEDDWEHALGDPAEERFAAALAYIESNGSLCAPTSVSLAAARSAGTPAPGLRAEGGETIAARLLGAY